MFPDILALGLRCILLTFSEEKILTEKQVYWGIGECHFEHIVFNVPVGHAVRDIW